MWSSVDTLARQTSYGLVSNWVKESKVGSVPSGQRKAKAGKRVAVSASAPNPFAGKTYPTTSYVRYFTKDALSHVPTDPQTGGAIVENSIFEVRDILRVRVRKGREEFMTKYRGYDDPEWSLMPRVSSFIARLKKSEKGLTRQKLAEGGAAEGGGGRKGREGSVYSDMNNQSIPSIRESTPQTVLRFCHTQRLFLLKIVGHHFRRIRIVQGSVHVYHGKALVTKIF
eukprot:SAG11_NODE_7956_length_1077_cov_7.382413_1_plen_226_part_00